MSDYDEQYEDDFEDAELNSVANKSSPRGYAPSTASSTTAAAAAGSSSRAHAIFAPTAAEFLGDGIAMAKKSAGVRGKQSMASSFSSYESSSADPLLRQGAHELSSSSPSPTSSNASMSARRQHHSRARSDRPNGTDESGRSSQTGGRGRAAATKEQQQQQQQPASGGLTAALPPYAAHGDDLNVVSAPTAGRASGRHDAYAELGDNEDDNEGDPYRELGDASKAQKAAAGASYHSSAKSSPHRGYPVEARGAATASTASSGSPSPLRGGVGAKGPSHDYNHAVSGSISSSPNRSHRDDNSSPNRNATSTNTSSSRGGPLPGAGRAAVVTAPEPPPRYTTQSQSSAAASHTSRTSSTASSSSTASRGRHAGGAAVASATRSSGPGMHASPNARDVSGERHGSDTTISGKKTSLHQSNYTRVEALEDERDDAVGRRSAAEIDAAATTVSDEEHDGAADAGGGFRANNTVSSVTALDLRAPSLRSEGYSDTFTNITATASTKQSHISHPRSPSPSNVPSSVPAAHESEESGSVVSPDAGNGIRFNNGTNRSGVVMPLSLMSPHLPNPSAPASPPRAGGDRTAAASTPTVTAPATAAQSSATSSSASPHTTAVRSRASLASTGSPLGPASVRGNARRRQLNAAAGETLDADAHVPVAPTPTPPPASSDSDTEESTPAPASAYKTPVAQRQQPETPHSANRTPRSAQDSRSWNDDHDDADVRSEVADSTAGSDERAVLLLRIAELRAEVTTWDSRIAKQRVALQNAHAAAAAAAESQPHSAEAGAGRGRRSGPTRGRRRVSSLQRLPTTRMNGGGAAAGRANGRAPAGARLAKLRAENKALEAKYARFGVEDGTGMGVQALVVRADIQLQKARERLKEVTAARRALENRDKRAAHTIEEVHRRMPAADELQQRQLNEGIYSRTALLRAVKELRAKLERTRASTRQMEEKFTELTALVRRKRLTNMPPKEYEALCAAQEKRAKAIERHKTAISVYTNAVAQDVRQGSSALARASPSSGSSCANSPHKAPSSRGQTPLGDPMHEEQVIAEYESTKAAQLLEQQKTLLERKQALETSIEELQRRVQQRNEQIKANHAVAGLLYLPDGPSQASSSAGAAAAYAPPYVVGGGPSPAKPTPRTIAVPQTAPVANSAIADVADPVAGSGAVAARKNSLRDVLRSPTKRRHEPVPVAPAPVGPGAAATNRLRGAVAAARERRQEEAGSDAKLSGTFSDAGAGRASRRPTPPQLTALAEAAAAEEEERARRGQLQHALNGKATKPVTSSSFADDDDDAGDVDDAGAEEHDSIEAMLRKIDEDNRCLGQAVFGHGAGQEAEEEEEQPQQHHNAAGSRGSGSGVSGKQPSFLQELDEDDGGDDAFPEEAHRAPPPSTGPAKSGPQSRGGAQSRSSGAGGVYDTFVEELDQASEVDDDVEDYIDDDDGDGAEDAYDEGGAAGGGTAAAAGGSGRSTPEWLRED